MRAIPIDDLTEELRRPDGIIEVFKVPTFSPSQVIVANERHAIISDVDGKLWFVCLDSGSVREIARA